MARYRFHALNGSEFVFDAVGKDIRVPDRVTRWARKVAQDTMRGLAGGGDWSDWYVSVHDLRGRRVLVQPFVGESEDGPRQAIPHPDGVGLGNGRGSSSAGSQARANAAN